MPYIVEEFTLCEGWVNNWTTEEPDGTIHPTTFDSREEAQAEIDELVEDMEDYEPENYRIQELNE